MVIINMKPDRDRFIYIRHFRYRLVYDYSVSLDLNSDHDINSDINLT